jgi:hypothetical protein
MLTVTILFHGCGYALGTRAPGRKAMDAGRDRGPKILFMVAQCSAGHLIEQEGLKLLNGAGQNSHSCHTVGRPPSPWSGAEQLPPSTRGWTSTRHCSPAAPPPFHSPETLPAGQRQRGIGGLLAALMNELGQTELPRAGRGCASGVASTSTPT